MITEKNPESWQQLQEWTAQILRECGWTAETEVKLTTVRGTAENDVFAMEAVQGREYKTLIECKNWTARVPQNVVHGFRTVMADVGANTGYIISKAGFQAGAHEAAANTNVRLLSWTEFQEVFVDQWYWTYLTQQTYEVLDPLCSYLEPVPAMAFWDSYSQSRRNRPPEGDVPPTLSLGRADLRVAALHGHAARSGGKDTIAAWRSCPRLWGFA